LETPVSEDLHEKIRMNSFGERIHLLFLNSTQLILNDTKINLTEISHFKFGVKIWQLGMFPVGRSYYISLKTPTQKLNLVLRSFFGIRDGYLAKLYERLADNISLKIGERLFREAVTVLKTGNSFNIGPCTVDKQGISLRTSPSNNLPLIPWHDLSYAKKYDRLVINSKSKRQIWFNLYFLEHWNVEVLMDVLDWLFEEGGLPELAEYTPAKE
jgi:hypothetical protein